MHADLRQTAWVTVDGVSSMTTMNAFACSVHVICYSVSGAWIYLQMMESGLAHARGLIM